MCIDKHTILPCGCILEIQVRYDACEYYIFNQDIERRYPNLIVRREILRQYQANQQSCRNAHSVVYDLPDWPAPVCERCRVEAADEGATAEELADIDDEGVTTEEQFAAADSVQAALRRARDALEDHRVWREAFRQSHDR